MNVTILESLGVSQTELTQALAPLQTQGVCFKVYERTADVDTLIQEAEEADVLILANLPLPAAVINACPKLKYINIAFTGVDHVDLAACRARGIQVSNASGYSDQAVAELALGLTLSLLRQINGSDALLRQGGSRQNRLGQEIAGKTAGIVGLGHIGLKSAELFHAFGARVLSQSRHHKPSAPEYIEQCADLETLLPQADIALLHCPLNDSTRGLINRRTLSLMKPEAILINVARGPIVNSADLALALQKGQLAGAGIDVFDAEPPLPADEPLLHAPHTILTPHLAYATQESMSRRLKITMANLTAWLNGAPVNLI
ncbi:hydroxyacid dehydrogenase [Oscillospiraceae bacterium HV4-5-C5C]|nr:hydroxyacid dehydrogenase [Oscillospiraceae bacterium HV4-5-C5C]